MIFLSLILPPLAFAFLFLIYYILIPYLKVNSYKNVEEALTYYYPIYGDNKRIKNSFLEHGDSMAHNKNFSKAHPHKKYTVTNLRNKTLFILQDPALVKELALKPNLYTKEAFLQILLPLLGNGLLLSEGSNWKRHRKITSSFFNYDLIKSNVRMVQKTAQEFLKKTPKEDYKNYYAIQEIQKITGEIVGRIFFGEKLNDYTCEGKPLTTALADLVSDIASYGRTPLASLIGPKIMNMPFIPQSARLMKRVNKFREICRQIVADKKAEKSGEYDLLNAFFKTQDSDDSNARFTDEDIIDEFITFFTAGMDTTGHLVGMTLYLLTQYPQYLEELKKERDEAFNKEAEVTADALHDMDSLHCFIKETLRLHTPVTGISTRTAVEDHKLGSINIKKGDIIKPSFLSILRDEKNFKNAEEFNPGRWKKDAEKIDPYAYTPFSAGPRNCIGQHLSLIEAKVIISEFLERFDFKLQDGFELKMVNRFLYEPVNDISLVLTPRN